MCEARDQSTTRESILEAAISIIEAEGETALRVDKVVADAGFTKPVLYHHFNDRDGLIAAAQAELFRRSLEHGIERATARVEAAQSQEEFIDVMRSLLAAYAQPDGIDRRKFRIRVLGAASSRPELLEHVRGASRRHVDEFAVLLGVAETRGWLRPGVPIRDFAQWWVGLVLSRHLFDIDPDGFNAGSWDELTYRVLALVVKDV